MVAEANRRRRVVAATGASLAARFGAGTRRRSSTSRPLRCARRSSRPGTRTACASPPMTSVTSVVGRVRRVDAAALSADDVRPAASRSRAHRRGDIASVESCDGRTWHRRQLTDEPPVELADPRPPVHPLPGGATSSAGSEPALRLIGGGTRTPSRRRRPDPLGRAPSGRGPRRACAVAGRKLTRAEWNDVLPGRPYAPACR